MDEQASFDYERSDIESGGVAWIALGLGLFVFAMPLLMPLVFPQAMRHVSPAAPPALSANAPELEVTPRQDLQRLDRAEAQVTDDYGWVDRDHGVVRIPVTHAMERLLQKGLPAWPSK
jgi:hypothetical protein